MIYYKYLFDNRKLHLIMLKLRGFLVMALVLRLKCAKRT